MSLEANIVEQLQELRKWQQQQQDELIRRQEEQRQKLTSEQSRVFEALSSSIDEMTLDEQSLKELIKEQEGTKEEEKQNTNLIDFETPVEEHDTLHDSEDCSKVEGNNEDSISETPRGKLFLRSGNDKPRSNASYNNSYSHNNTSMDLFSEDVSSYCSDKSISHRSILIDDIPLPSPKKDFSTLLEEKLKDPEALPIETTKKPVVKRPFLKKGQGLARFQPNPNASKSPMCKARQRSASFSTGTQSTGSKPSKSTKLSRCNSLPKSKKCDTKKSTPSANARKTVSSANVKKAASPVNRVPKISISPAAPINKKLISPLPAAAQTRLSLKNVPAPQRKVFKKPNANFQSKKIAFEKKKTAEVTSDVSNSDLEVKTKRELEEVRIFELLEDKAENSSFCSTSSTVIAFLQQSSTPLKHKALLHSATKNQISLNNVGDQTLEDIVSSMESNNLLVPKAQKNVENQNISQWEVVSRSRNIKTENGPILPYGTDIDMHYDEYPNQDLVEDQNNVSLHVRFAEYNEYNEYNDASSVSSGSVHVNDFKDQGVWSDNSETPDNSDVESIKQLKSSCTNVNRPQVPYICVTNESDDTEYEDEESQNIYIQHQNQEDKQESENDYDAESKNDTISSADTVIEKDDVKTLFKSELLRQRLLELEHEIEVFRKESAALTVLKQKLQEERTNLCEEKIQVKRSLKEKEAALEAEKKKAESILQDEKKRLAREKAALESRMKDAYEKAQKSKQERQEIQTLREQLEELREEMEQKENKWSAASARQRSQIRVLQAENAKLKQEIEQMLQKQKARLKRAVNPNTRAIHQISKTLGERKKLLSTKSEEPAHHDEHKQTSQAHDMNYEADLEAEAEKPVEVKRVKIPKSIESIARTRNLYEHLLKDATEDFGETQINGRHLQNHAEADDEDEEDNQVENEEEEEEEEDQCAEDNQDQEDIGYDEACSQQVDAEQRSQASSKQVSWSNKLDQSRSSDLNKSKVKEVRHADGRIEYWYPNGNVKKVFPEDGITKTIFYNGDVREMDKNGVVKYFYAQTRTWHTTLPDGLEILEFPNGQVERKSKDGVSEVSYPDGSIKITQADGREKWALKDGTVAETTADGDKIINFPNGQIEVHTKDHKRREYPDGTVKLMYLDGTQETRYANGRVRLKDKAGNLLMDTHQ